MSPLVKSLAASILLCRENTSHSGPLARSDGAIEISGSVGFFFYENLRDEDIALVGEFGERPGGLPYVHNCSTTINIPAKRPGRPAQWIDVRKRDAMKSWLPPDLGFEKRRSGPSDGGYRGIEIALEFVWCRWSSDRGRDRDRCTQQCCKSPHGRFPHARRIETT